MSDVLDYVRERNPNLAEVPDRELTLYIGDRQPNLLNQDRDFQREYNRLSLSRSKQEDLAATAKRENRKASIAYTAEQLARGVALEPILKPLGTVTHQAGRMVTGLTQDIASGWTPGPAQYSVGENLAAATLGEQTPFERETAPLTYQEAFLPKAMAETSQMISGMIPKLVVAGGLGKVFRAGGMEELPASMAGAALAFGAKPEGYDVQEGVLMGLFPAASKAGQSVALRALEKLGVKFETKTAAQAFGQVGGLAGAQAYMEVLNTPQYLSGDLSREEKLGLFTQGLALNLGMHLPGVAGLIKGGVDELRIRAAVREAAQAEADAIRNIPRATGEPPKPVEVQTPEQADAVLKADVEGKLTIRQIEELNAQPPEVRMELARNSGLVRGKGDYPKQLAEARERALPAPLAVREGTVVDAVTGQPAVFMAPPQVSGQRTEDRGPAQLGDARRLALLEDFAAGRPIAANRVAPGEESILAPAGYTLQGDTWVRQSKLEQPLPEIGKAEPEPSRPSTSAVGVTPESIYEGRPIDAVITENQRTDAPQTAGLYTQDQKANEVIQWLLSERTPTGQTRAGNAAQMERFQTLPDSSVSVVRVWLAEHGNRYEQRFVDANLAAIVRQRAVRTQGVVNLAAAAGQPALGAGAASPRPMAGPEIIAPPPAKPAPAAPPELDASTTQFAPGAIPTVEVPISRLKLSKDVPNFKADADKATGVVRGQQLEGTYERRGTAPIVAWERLNGDLEVITGRHRLDLARRSGEKTIPTQIVRERDGFTKEHALTFDAEANIRDGQGTVEDYAHYFRNSPTLAEGEAVSRGLLSRAKGKEGWSLGKLAADDLYAIFAADKINTARAVAIARTAPNNPDLQALGIKQALKGRSPTEIENFIRVVAAETRGGTAEQIDMFGRDDSALRQAEAMAGRASKFQSEILEQVRAVQSAAKRPEAAAKLGVNVTDPEGVLKRVDELRAEYERWQSWPQQPDLVALVKGEKPKPATAKPAGPDLFPGSDMPFNLEQQKAKFVEPTQTKTQFGAETLTQTDLFQIEKVVSEVDPGKSANAAQRMYGGPAAAAKVIRRQLAVIDGDKKVAKTFTKEQRGRLKEVMAMLEQRASKGETLASPPMLGRGGELGTEPPPPADNPKFSAFDASPMELPEAVQMVKQLTGFYPRIREKLRNAFGIFRPSTGEIQLRADIFDLLTKEEKDALRQQAEDYAHNVAERGDDAAKIAQERYEYLLERAYEEAATRNPIQALKTAWHEIGHLLDWLPDRMISGRGNIFGRLAAATKEFRRHVLPIDPAQPAGKPLTRSEKSKLEHEAERQLRDEMGPIRELVKTIIIEEPEWQITGIKPEDITNILREGAGKETPELTRWFAEQSSKVKAEILRKAMRGLVDERLAALGTKKQVGTRKTTRTVREKVGREPTREEIKARFRELFRQAMRERNLAELAALKAELEPLIAWWRGTDTIPPYFKQAHEMYADAFSVLANNPAAVRARAPLYYELFFNYLDRKPEFKALYDGVQADIKAGRIMGERVKNLRESWNRDDERSLDIARERLTTRGRNFLDNVVYHFDRRFGPIYRTAKGTVTEGETREAVGTYLYRATEHERYLGTLNREVGRRLVEHNLDWNDLGESLFLHRITTDRMNLANPLGWTPKNALERLAEMQRDLGPERWAELEHARADYRRLYEDHVLSVLNDAQMFSPELMHVINERVDYATFAAVRNLPDEGIKRMLETAYGASVTPHIYRQVGNLGEIKNPATATVLKGLSLISAAYRNNMKREVVAMLQANDPHGIAPARRRWTGKRQEAVIIDNHPTVGTIIYLREGKPEAFYVRKVVADAVNHGSPTENVLYSALIRATGWQKGLFTQLNYAFWPVNFVRDTLAWQMQLPGASPLAYARVLGPAIKAARDSVTHRRANPLADQALRRKMLISRGDPRGVWAAADNEFDMKLSSFGVDPAQWSKQADKVHTIVKAWNYYRELGQTVERVNKIAGMLHLDRKFPSMPEWKKREIVRERSGSPNFLERGASNPAVDLMFLFYNPWKEGIRSLAKSARENPFAFGAKATVAIALPTILQAAAVNGWLGEELRKLYRSMSDYDLTNYLNVPLGWVDEAQGKVVSLRLPLWEPARIAHGLLFQTLTGRGQGIMSHAGGQVPGLNPLLKVAVMWAEYALGKNPVDLSRSVNVLTETQQDARGPEGDIFSAPALQQMLKQTWNEAGGSIITRFKNLNLESPPETVGEEFLSLPVVNNALGRWVKVSDRGIFDADQKLIGAVEQRRSQIQLAVQPIIEKLTKGQGLAALTESELRLLLNNTYARQYLDDRLPGVWLGQQSLLLRRLNRSGTTEGKAAILSNE